MKSDIVRFAAILATATNPVPLDFEGIETPNHVKWDEPPIKYFEHPINNRHERRKQKAMKRNKK